MTQRLVLFTGPILRSNHIEFPTEHITNPISEQSRHKEMFK